MTIPKLMTIEEIFPHMRVCPTCNKVAHSDFAATFYFGYRESDDSEILLRTICRDCHYAENKPSSNP